jgi:hypothetical protein
MKEGDTTNKPGSDSGSTLAATNTSTAGATSTNSSAAISALALGVPLASDGTSSSNVSSSSAAAKTAQLSKIPVEQKGEKCGAFSYSIKWLLSNRLPFDTIIVQELKVDYHLDYKAPGKDTEIEEGICISDLKGSTCTWDKYPHYWEMWCIPAGELSPAYDENGYPDFPSNKKKATPSKGHDDIYSNGSIMENGGTCLTLGWVRYTATATLYDFNLLGGWKGIGMFKVDLQSPAWALHMTQKNPGLNPKAIVGTLVPHDMVVYWNTFGLGGWTRATKIEIDQSYNKQGKVLLRKAKALNPLALNRPASGSSNQGQNQFGGHSRVLPPKPITGPKIGVYASPSSLPNKPSACSSQGQNLLRGITPVFSSSSSLISSYSSSVSGSLKRKTSPQILKLPPAKR